MPTSDNRYGWRGKINPFELPMHFSEINAQDIMNWCVSEWDRRHLEDPIILQMRNVIKPTSLSMNAAMVAQVAASRLKLSDQHEWVIAKEEMDGKLDHFKSITITAGFEIGSPVYNELWLAGTTQFYIGTYSSQMNCVEATSVQMATHTELTAEAAEVHEYYMELKGRRTDVTDSIGEFTGDGTSVKSIVNIGVGKMFKCYGLAVTLLAEDPDCTQKLNDLFPVHLLRNIASDGIYPMIITHGTFKRICILMDKANKTFIIDLRDCLSDVTIAYSYDADHAGTGGHTYAHGSRYEVPSTEIGNITNGDTKFIMGTCLSISDSAHFNFEITGS
ncbi:MAG: hypothetical protein WCL14_03405 [Bacteroidota bacterium]